MTMLVRDLENMYVWLGRLENIPAQEAREFVECVDRLEKTIEELKAAAAKAPGIPMVPPKPVASSDDTKPTPKIKEAINTILRESKKQKDAAAKKASRRSTGR